jgi:hypothetical protein
MFPGGFMARSVSKQKNEIGAGSESEAAESHRNAGVSGDADSSGYKEMKGGRRTGVKGGAKTGGNAGGGRGSTGGKGRKKASKAGSKGSAQGGAKKGGSRGASGGRGAATRTVGKLKPGATKG